MPEKHIRREFEKLNNLYNNSEKIEKMASIFNVSEETMGIRLDTLGLIVNNYSYINKYTTR